MAKADDENRRQGNYLRAAAAYECEVLRRALGPIGRDDLPMELGWPGVRLTAGAWNDHPLIRDAYPLHLEVRFSGASNPPPVPSRRDLPPLEGMVKEFPDTMFHAYCVKAKEYEPGGRGFGVVFPYNGSASLILHDRPHLANGPPLVLRRLGNGARVAVHWFPPFADDLAEACRGRFAAEGGRLAALIESNHDFRTADWRLWTDRPKPTGW